MMSDSALTLGSSHATAMRPSTGSRHSTPPPSPTPRWLRMPGTSGGHASRSSGEAETYALSTSPDLILHRSYVVEEGGKKPVPSPFVINCDATVAIAFSGGSTGRSRMKHIDQRQAWVRQLRDAALTKANKVPTNDNLADLFTKVLKGASFTSLRDRFLFSVPQPAVAAAEGSARSANGRERPSKKPPQSPRSTTCPRGHTEMYRISPSVSCCSSSTPREAAKSIGIGLHRS